MQRKITLKWKYVFFFLIFALENWQKWSSRVSYHFTDTAALFKKDQTVAEAKAVFKIWKCTHISTNCTYRLCNCTIWKFLMKTGKARTGSDKTFAVVIKSRNLIQNILLYILTWQRYNSIVNRPEMNVICLYNILKIRKASSPQIIE